MYESHFGLECKPFRLTPDASFFFPSEQHRRGLAFLEYGLHEGEGFVVITGEPGTGKSTLVGKLIMEHDQDPLDVATIETTAVTEEGLLQLALIRFGLTPPESASGKTAALQRLQQGLLRSSRSGRRAVLIVDEAQNLPDAALEELRMLSNFTVQARPLLQIFLVGQPALRERIESPGLEQLRQRIVASYHLEALETAAHVRDYVEFRLRQAGWDHEPEFVDDAFEAIRRQTGGLPRLINILCDRLLLFCFIENRCRVDHETVVQVAKEAGIHTRGETARAARIGEGPSAAVPAAARGQLELFAEAVERLRAVERRIDQMEKRVYIQLRLIRRCLDRNEHEE